jgi:hypothetical protein
MAVSADWGRQYSGLWRRTARDYLMDETDFTKAVFEHSRRPALTQALIADPILLDRARMKVKLLELAQERGQLFDRDAVARMTHEMLTKLLVQVDVAKSQPPQVRVIE